MKDTIANKIASFAATLDVADSTDFVPIWTNQQPLKFGVTLAAARPMITAVKAKGAKQSANIGGVAAGLRALRTDFERKMHVLARAVYQCLLAQNNAADAGRVNFTPSGLKATRGVLLAGMGETLLEIAEPLLAGTPAPATDHFTQAQLDAVDDLWQQYSTAVGAPAGARSKRKGLTKELPDDVRAVEAKLSTCDDYVPQFADVSDMGRQFADAWFAARHVSDLGRRASKPEPPTPPTPTPPNP